jgi:hypothetical protein
VYWSFLETTDGDGRYAFDRFVPGQGGLSRPIELYDEKGAFGMNSNGWVSIRLEPGKTA